MTTGCTCPSPWESPAEMCRPPKGSWAARDICEKLGATWEVDDCGDGVEGSYGALSPANEALYRCVASCR